MTPNVMKVLKTVVGIASLALPFASSYFENKEMKDMIAKEVAKALEEKMRES